MEALNKRREKINQHFIELSTVIPDLKKVLIQPTLSLSPATYIICYFFSVPDENKINS